MPVSVASASGGGDRAAGRQLRQLRQLDPAASQYERGTAALPIRIDEHGVGLRGVRGSGRSVSSPFRSKGAVVEPLPLVAADAGRIRKRCEGVPEADVIRRSLDDLRRLRVPLP